MVSTTAAPARIAAPNVRGTTASSAAREFLAGLRRLRSWLATTGGHGVWIALWSLIGWGGTIAAPFLTDAAPFLVMLMAPRALFVAMAAESVDLLTFVMLGTARLGATDASYFILGRRLERTERPARRIARGLWHRIRNGAMAVTDALCRWLCSHGLRAGAVLFLRPNGKYLAVAGAYGVSARLAGAASVLGTAIYLATMHLGVGLLL